jgi:microcystin degradation protein MlrC
MHGFPWADWSQAGASVLVVSDDADQAAIDRIADALADEFIGIADGQAVERLTLHDAVSAALAAQPGRGPVIIADSSDNPGGGAACDSTFLLRELVDRGCENAALGMIWDPQVAQIAANSGVGTTLRLRIGGKIGPLSGNPVDLECEVLGVGEDLRQRMFSEEPNVPIGLAVGLRAGGVDIVVNSIRQQTFDPGCFESLGIDVASKSIVVVKSSQHFRALFDPIARETIYCDAPGSLTLDLAQLPYRTMTLTRSKAAYRTGQPARMSSTRQSQGDARSVS